MDSVFPVFFSVLPSVKHFQSQYEGSQILVANMFFFSSSLLTEHVRTRWLPPIALLRIGFDIVCTKENREEREHSPLAQLLHTVGEQHTNFVLRTATGKSSLGSCLNAEIPQRFKSGGPELPAKRAKEGSGAGPWKSF